MPTAMANQVVVVDDDRLFRETLVMNLEDAGFTVVAFDGGTGFLAQLEQGWRPQAALIILDLDMPGASGFDLIRHLRSRTISVPVIVLTSHSGVSYEDTAFSLGAVDFVDKVRGFSILLHRMRRLLQAPVASSDDAVTVADQPPGPDDATSDQDAAVVLGPLRLDPETSRAHWRGLRVDLTLTEYRLVRFMAERAGRDLRYRTLYDEMRGSGFTAGAGDQGYRDNVRAAVKRIRQKFKALDPDFTAIENYAGFGYRWRNDGD